MNHSEKEWMEIFIKNKAYLKGHFCLSSGMHSQGYLQSALLLKNPCMAQSVAEDLLQKISFLSWDFVIGPALGSLIIGHELAKNSQKEFLFMERLNGSLMLRRGFSLDKKKRVLVIEDVVTTGFSAKEVIKFLKKNNNRIVGVVSIVNRSKDTLDFDCPFVSLLKISLDIYDPKDCPLCRESHPLTSPGSRFLVG